MLKEQVKSSARAGGAVLLVVFGMRVLLALVAALMNLLFEKKWYVDWVGTIAMGMILGVGFGAVVFVASLFQQRRIMKFVETVAPDEDEVRQGQELQTAPPEVTGFAAMEYYSLILNRSYLVYVAPEGIYGWRFEGMVDASDPTYFEPYVRMLEDPNLLPATRKAREELARESGNFHIPQRIIRSVEYDPTAKWGMGGVPHSGKLRLRLENGKSRQFILLGSVDGDGIMQSIVKHGVLAMSRG